MLGPISVRGVTTRRHLARLPRRASKHPSRGKAGNEEEWRLPGANACYIAARFRQK